MKNREVYEKDPGTNTLLNQGVAKVAAVSTDTELKTLRYEIDNFVCDGQYERGLDRILSAYLGHLDKTEQPGVWVSGFYGSGKSHLVKMLQHLWVDTRFPDGATARGQARLTPRVKEHFKELATNAKRAGGLHAAAGELKYRADRSIRLEVLGIMAKSRELPDDYARAGFLLWLRQEGIEKAVRDAVAAAGRDFDFELENLYVSDPIPKAVLAARPDFAHGPADARLLIEKQFPERADVSDDELVSRMKLMVAGKGKFPCTLVVLDEVQQYIGESVDRSKAVQEVQQVLCARLGPQFMLVGTGQYALSSTPLLQRLAGRFPVTVELQDTDVEQVTREVVLKKKPSAEEPIKALMEKHSPEVERQLVNTRIGFTTRDRGLLFQDYPILPVRRRFWERVIRAVDKAGTGAQLRTQLWIVYDAAQKTAGLDLGNVVGGAFLFEHIKTRVLQSGVLLQEISETIARQAQEDDGELRYQLCSLIFLIGQLPHEGPADAGVRADADTLADLLVTDLTKSSGELRKRVADLLAKLVACGAVMQVEDEYRMQTREGSEWNQAYQEAKNRLMGDPGKLASERSQLLKTQCGDMLVKAKLPHGASKVARKIEPHFGADPPSANGAAIPVWVRDGWEVNEKVVLNDARAAGENAAVVFAFVPQTKAGELKQAIASHYAATATLQAKGTPSTDEGEDAKRAMETRRDIALRTRDAIVADILNDTQVYVAGGDPVAGVLLESKVQDAARACLDRLYPDFRLADHPATDWDKVPATPADPGGLDVWDFRYRPAANLAGRSEHVVPGTQTTSPCDSCEGRGDVPCGTCGGGRAVVCPTCRGGGTELCDLCAGTRFTQVRTGTLVEEERCYCEGGWINFGRPEQRPCARCNGRGVISRSADDYGDMPCPCGTGEVQCSTCRGGKQVRCAACTGTGRAKCGPCRGCKRVVRFATVCRTFEPWSRSATAPGRGCDPEAVDAIARRNPYPSLARLVVADPLPDLDLGPTGVATTIRSLLDAVRAETTDHRRIGSLSVEVGSPHPS